MFRKMPFVLLGMIIVVGVAYPWISPTSQSVLYGISLSLKSLIVFTLPFLIFGLLFKTAVQLSKSASKWILLILVSICLSNCISTLLSYTVGSFAYQFDLTMSLPEETLSLVPIGDFSLPKVIGNGTAMFSGLILGVLCGWIKPVLAGRVSNFLEKVVSFVLRAFLYVIPVFIIGFVVKLMHDGVLNLILRNYSLIFALIAGAVFSYICILYLVIHKFKGKAFIQSIKNMLPAAIAGFGSMSSAAVMPLTILGTEKNSKNPDVARSIIPVTVNIPLMGDCFAIPIFAFAVMKSFGVAEPAFYELSDLCSLLCPS